MQKTLTMTRRSFVKAAAVAGAALALSTRLSGSLAKTDKAFADPVSERKRYVVTCHGCIQACPARAYVQDGVVVKLEGHPYSLQNQGSMCLKGLSQLHTVYSPRRVLYPLKRSGPRGAEEMAWERVSWQEAVELAASKIAESIEKYGTYSIFASVGGGGSYSFTEAMSFPLAFYSPTVFEPGCAQCYLPRYTIADLMYGGHDQSIADCAVLEPWKGLSFREKEAGVVNSTDVLVLWGAQPSVSQTAQSGRSVAELRAKGCKTIVVDPSMTPDAVKATVWLRIRPATDPALILSWYRYIFANKLYDEAFVKEWTNLPFIIDPNTKLPLYATDVWPEYEQKRPLHSPAYVCYDNITRSLQPFEYADPSVDPEIFWSGNVAVVTTTGTTTTTTTKSCRTAGQIYKDAAEPYTLAKAAEICWVPMDLNEKAIRIYADAYAAGIGNGVHSEMTETASEVPLGLMGLDMIMGYVNKAGCTLAATGAGNGNRITKYFNGFGGTYGQTYGGSFQLGATVAQNEARIAAMTQANKDRMYVFNQLLLDRLGMNNHRGLYQWMHSHIPTVLDAIKRGIPYKPRVWYDFSGNKLMALGNSSSWYDAFDQIDFCICQYPMITSFQAEIADVIYPMEEWLEQPGASTFGQLGRTFADPGIIHLGETVPHNVGVNWTISVASAKLNAKIAGGTKIVIGATGATAGLSGTPSKYTSDYYEHVAGNEAQTSTNSTAYHVATFGYNETTMNAYTPTFPLTNVGSASESGARNNQLAGAATYEDMLASPDQYLEPYYPTYPTANSRWALSNRTTYWSYGQHLTRSTTDGLPRGFGTESRRCEVYCSILIKLSQTGFPYCYPRARGPVDSSIGANFKAYDPTYEYQGMYSPICQYVEPAESPIPGAIGYDPKYPLVITSGRVYYSHHGTMRHAPYLRELYPVPDVRMHPDTAAKYGLKHMDWVKVTSRRAYTTGRVYVTRGQAPGSLWMERHWNPECFDESQPSKSGGWRECNINVITKNTAPYNTVFGSYSNRGFTVNIEKTTRPDRIWVEPKEFQPFMPTNPNQYVAGIGSALELPQTDFVVREDW